MQSDAERVVRAIYEAWGQGRSARDWIAEDVEYVNPEDAVEPGVRRGREAFRRIRDVYDDVEVVPERYIPVGEDEVVVLATLSGKARGSGVEVVQKQGYVWTVRGGRAIRMRWFTKPGHALRAAGVREHP